MPRDLFDGRTGFGAGGRRILYCWLPCFATDRIARRRPALAAQPVAVVRHERGRCIAVAVNGPARRSGVRPGQSLADARSLCPALKAVEADPAADSRLLLHLARWCTRYTPWVAPEAPADDDLPAPTGPGLPGPRPPCCSTSAGAPIWRAVKKCFQEDLPTDWKISVLSPVAQSPIRRRRRPAGRAAAIPSIPSFPPAPKPIG